MTAPVSTRITTGTAAIEEGTREMCFPLGTELQSNTPTPTNPLVYIHERPTMNVYTRWGMFSVALFKSDQTLSLLDTTKY